MGFDEHSGKRELKRLLLGFISAFILTLSTQVAATEERAMRIVALEFSFVDALASVGVSPVGIADDQKPEKMIDAVRERIQPWTSVGLRSQPSLEVIAQLQPDLIIADSGRHRSVEVRLSEIAKTIFVKSKGESYEENLQSALIIGKAIQKEEAMKTRIAKHRRFMAAIDLQCDNHETFQFAVATEHGVWLHGPGSYAGGVLHQLGLKSPIPKITQPAYLQVNFESMLYYNPDWLLVGEYHPRNMFVQWQKSELSRFLKANKYHQLLHVDASLWSLSRGMIAAEQIAVNVRRILESRCGK